MIKVRGKTFFIKRLTKQKKKCSSVKEKKKKKYKLANK